jgi:muramidase (phage lysozyme)
MTYTVCAGGGVLNDLTSHPAPLIQRAQVLVEDNYKPNCTAANGTFPLVPQFVHLGALVSTAAHAA